jgi:hypothetical protein
MYYSKDLVDWLLINMTFSNDSSKIKWSCDDGHSTIADIKNIQQDDRINCFLADEKNKAEVYKDRGNFQAHFVKPFGTDDVDGQDIKLRPISLVGA